MSRREHRVSLRRDMQEGSYCAQFKTYHDEMKENEKEEPSVTEAELARVLELDAKATQGPIDVWTHETNGEVSYRLRAPAHRNMAWVAQYDDALALAEYRTLTPRLARELAAARAALAGLMKAIEVTFWTSDDGETKCRADADSLRLEYSQELGDAFEAALNTHTHE